MRILKELCNLAMTRFTASRHSCIYFASTQSVNCGERGRDPSLRREESDLLANPFHSHLHMDAAGEGDGYMPDEIARCVEILIIFLIIFRVWGTNRIKSKSNKKLYALLLWAD